MAEPKYYDELPTYIMHSDGEFADGKFRAVDGSGNSLDISLPVDSENNAESIVIETSDTKGTISVGYSETDNQASVTVTGDLSVLIGDKKFRLYLAKVTIAGNTIDSVELSVEDGENNVIALSVPSTTFIMSAIANLINQRVPANIKDGGGTGAIIEGMIGSSIPAASRNEASGEYAHAEGGVAFENNGEMTYMKSVASGISSHAETRGQATGNYSHAEGAGQASGEYAHAEGFSSKATGNYSHSEGSGTASGAYSHAENFSSKAVGQYSHAEGSQTNANARASHAEGTSTTADGLNSHSQNEYTIAKGKSQTVIGKYNAEQGTSDSYTNTDYAFIIGNGTGTSASARSNALAVRWDGAIVLADGTVLTVEQLAKVANLT